MYSFNWNQRTNGNKIIELIFVTRVSGRKCPRLTPHWPPPLGSYDCRIKVSLRPFDWGKTKTTEIAQRLSDEPRENPS